MASKSKANRVMGIAPATERDWQAEGDCDTLMRACEIKKDPKRLKAAQRVAKERMKQLQEGALQAKKY
jgi:hypothetical protein